MIAEAGGPSAEFAVVGAGPAGVTMARRLAEAGRDVVLLEAGSGPPFPVSVAGIDGIGATTEPGFHWPGLRTGPTGRTGPDHEGRVGRDTDPRLYLQGRGLGGGSLINGMLLSPGDRADYDRWADRHRCPAWSADEIAPWLDVVVVTMAGAFSHPEPGPISRAFQTEAEIAGHPVGGSSLDQDATGSLRAALAAGDGVRAPVGLIHGLHGSHGHPGLRGLDDVAGPGRPKVVTNAAVERLRPDRAGVDVELAGGPPIRVDRVVVSAGAVGSPGLLHRSGLATDRVGRAVRDHPSFPFAIVTDPGATGGDGPQGAVSRLLRWSSGEGSEADLQAFVLDRIGGGRGLAVAVVGLMSVRSVGRLDLDGPVVDPGWLRHDDDRARLRSGVRHIGRLLGRLVDRGVAFEAHVDRHGTPVGHLPAVSDDDLDRLMIDRPGPYAHLSGACRMGPEDDPEAVVSARPGHFGRLLGSDGVVGLDRLRVVDASILPDLVSGGLQLPVMAVAERVAADLLS